MSEHESVASGSRTFHCPQCRGEMLFDAQKQGLACKFCSHVMAIPAQEGRRSIVEYDLSDGLARSAERGLGTAVRTTRCQECGAVVSFPESMTATACDFCGSSQVLEQEANRNLIRPESLLPFQLDRQAASKQFSAWLGRLWLRPSDLRAKAKVTEISGIYVPYWSFDANVSSNWTAQSGTYYYETEEVTEQDDKGNDVTRTREVRKVRWEPAWGSRSDAYDDLLVHASRGLPEELARRVQRFDTTALKPFDPAFLAGWKAEEYSVDINEAWKRAVARMERSQERRCADDVPGDTHRYLNVVNTFSEERYKHVLLPVWISAYRYNDKIYRFLVNGQTGEVVGKAPWSVPKIALLVLSIVGLATLAAYLYARLAA